jgi:hypothetical protein
MLRSWLLETSQKATGWHSSRPRVCHTQLTPKALHVSAHTCAFVADWVGLYLLLNQQDALLLLSTHLQGLWVTAQQGHSMRRSQYTATHNACRRSATQCLTLLLSQNPVTSPASDMYDYWHMLQHVKDLLILLPHCSKPLEFTGQEEREEFTAAQLLILPHGQEEPDTPKGAKQGPWGTPMQKWLVKHMPHTCLYCSSIAAISPASTGRMNRLR